MYPATLWKRKSEMVDQFCWKDIHKEVTNLEEKEKDTKLAVYFSVEQFFGGIRLIIFPLE